MAMRPGQGPMPIDQNSLDARGTGIVARQAADVRMEFILVEQPGAAITQKEISGHRKQPGRETCVLGWRR